MENLLLERMHDFDENYKLVQEKIAAAAEKSGRRAEEITLLAATKTVPAALINHAVDAGISYIGENRVQELMDKYDELRTDCTRHFIGRLQSNKVKYLTGRVSCIQSVDSPRLAREIARQSEKSGVVTDILIEVNIGREENKGGVLPEQLWETLDEIRQNRSIMIKGLMAVPPVCADKRVLSGFFSKMNQYYVDIRDKKLDNVSMQCLSMGMSADFETAIEQGATMVRLGSVLFGARRSSPRD